MPETPEVRSVDRVAEDPMLSMPLELRHCTGVGAGASGALLRVRVRSTRQKAKLIAGVCWLSARSVPPGLVKPQLVADGLAVCIWIRNEDLGQKVQS